MLPYDECEAYVQHLLAEHRRLHTMLRLARAAIRHSAGPDRDVTTSDIVRVLRQVREELAHHFADEEAGGCIEEAVSRCPQISHQADRVQGEHPELLGKLDALIAEVLDSRHTVAERITVQREFDELCKLLHAHEAAENDLLRHGFGVNVNGDANGGLPLPLDV
jgi:hypothetical protein